MKVLHLEGGEGRRDRQTHEALRCTQGRNRRNGKGRIFKSIWLENSPLLKMKELNIRDTQNHFLRKVKNHLKIHNTEKNITFIREADTRVQLKGARQILFF